MDKNKYGVHASHCCVKHGCKYGETDCPVVNGEIKQDYICEYCDMDGIKTVDELYQFLNNEKDKNKMILDELKGWLQQGIVSLSSDYIHLESERLRLDEKVSTMKMVLGKISEFERSL